MESDRFWQEFLEFTNAKKRNGENNFGDGPPKEPTEPPSRPREATGAKINSPNQQRDHFLANHRNSELAVAKNESKIVSLQKHNQKRANDFAKAHYLLQTLTWELSALKKDFHLQENQIQKLYNNHLIRKANFSSQITLSHSHTSTQKKKIRDQNRSLFSNTSTHLQQKKKILRLDSDHQQTLSQLEIEKKKKKLQEQKPRSVQSSTKSCQKVKAKTRLHPDLLCILCACEPRAVHQKGCRHCLLCWRCFLCQWENGDSLCILGDCGRRIKKPVRMLLADKNEGRRRVDEGSLSSSRG